MTGNQTGDGETGRQNDRATAYKALSALFYPPDEHLPDILSDLHAALERCCPESAAYAADLLTESGNYLEDTTDLQVDHAKLFLGPNVLLAAPYGSIYLEAERKIMGDTTMNALEHYRAVGLAASADVKQPPDFIATELEFLYFLIHCHLQTGEAEFLLRQLAFLQEHPGRWIEAFCETIDREAATDFYRLLAAATRSFVLADQAYLGELKLTES